MAVGVADSPHADHGLGDKQHLSVYHVTLYLRDVTATTGQQLTTIQFSPPPATPTGLPSVTLAKPTTTFLGKLARTPDGNFIIGMSSINSNAQTVLFRLSKWRRHRFSAGAQSRVSPLF